MYTKDIKYVGIDKDRNGFFLFMELYSGQRLRTMEYYPTVRAAAEALDKECDEMGLEMYLEH